MMLLLKIRAVKNPNITQERALLFMLSKMNDIVATSKICRKWASPKQIFVRYVYFTRKDSIMSYSIVYSPGLIPDYILNRRAVCVSCLSCRWRATLWAFFSYYSFTEPILMNILQVFFSNLSSVNCCIVFDALKIESLQPAANHCLKVQSGST